jgi:hypothetical protein
MFILWCGVIIGFGNVCIVKNEMCEVGWKHEYACPWCDDWKITNDDDYKLYIDLPHDMDLTCKFLRAPFSFLLCIQWQGISKHELSKNILTVKKWLDKLLEHILF